MEKYAGLNITPFHISNLTQIEINNNRQVNNSLEGNVRTIFDIVRPTIIVFGTIGNILSFVIMRKGTLKKVSTCFYMAMLALADTGNTITHFYI